MLLVFPNINNLIFQRMVCGPLVHQLLFKKGKNNWIFCDQINLGNSVGIVSFSGMFVMPISPFRLWKVLQKRTFLIQHFPNLFAHTTLRINSANILQKLHSVQHPLETTGFLEWHSRSSEHSYILQVLGLEFSFHFSSFELWFPRP